MIYTKLLLRPEQHWLELPHCCPFLMQPLLSNFFETSVGGERLDTVEHTGQQLPISTVLANNIMMAMAADVNVEIIIMNMNI